MFATRGGRRPGTLPLALFLGGSVVGCAGIPEEAYQLPPSSESVREAQTRVFEVPAEADIMQATVALMQDMEYNFDTIEISLGVLSGSKVVEADSVGKNVGLIAADIALGVLSVLTGSMPGGSLYAGADDEIKLTVTLVVLPSQEKEGYYSARITIRSELIDKMDRVREVLLIENPVVFQEIFEKLSKSLYLEGVK